MSGYPDRLIGNVNTAEEKGITRITNSVGDVVQSVLVLIKSQIFSNLLFTVVGNNTVGEIMDVFNSNFKLKPVTDDLDSIIKVFNKLPMGKDLSKSVDDIQNAMNIFPSESFVNEQIEVFNGHVETLTGSMEKTKNTMKQCNDNAGDINVNGLNETDMGSLDYLVSQINNITVNNLKGMNEVPLSTFDMFIEGGLCNDLANAGEECKENMTVIIAYLEQCNNEDIAIVNQIYEMKDKCIEILNEYVGSTFKEIQDAVEKVDLTQLKSDVYIYYIIIIII